MPDVSALRLSPTCAVPSMTGTPSAGTLSGLARRPLFRFIRSGHEIVVRPLRRAMSVSRTYTEVVGRTVRIQLTDNGSRPIERDLNAV